MHPIFFVTAAAVCVLAGGSVQAQNLLQDGGFETSSIVTLTQGSSNSFVYPQDTVNGWTYVGTPDSGSGLVNGSSTNGFLVFAQPTGYGGKQYAFLQASSSLSQGFATSTAGTLTIGWLEASRTGGSNTAYAGEQNYSVLVDGFNYGTSSTLSGQNFQAVSVTSTLQLAAGNHTLSFVGLTGPDHTAFIDNVSVTLSPWPPFPNRRPGR